jgi:hypothetical protein
MLSEHPTTSNTLQPARISIIKSRVPMRESRHVNWTPGIMTDPTSPNTFAVFVQLPLETKLTNDKYGFFTWKETPFGGQRIYIVDAEYMRADFGSSVHLRLDISRTESRPVPSLLSVCQESRHASQKEYTTFVTRTGQEKLKEPAMPTKSTTYSTS